MCVSNDGNMLSILFGMSHASMQNLSIWKYCHKVPFLRDFVSQETVCGIVHNSVLAGL